MDRQSVEDIAHELRVACVHDHGTRLGVEADDAVTEIAAHAHEHGLDLLAHALLARDLPFRSRVLEIHARRKVGDEDQPGRLRGFGRLAVLSRQMELPRHGQAPGESGERQATQERRDHRPTPRPPLRPKRQPGGDPYPTGMQGLRQCGEQQHQEGGVYGVHGGGGVAV